MLFRRPALALLSLCPYALPAAGPAHVPKDANYLALRNGQPDQSFAVNGVKLKRDVATIQLVRGQISFLPATAGRRAIAVFSGEGRITVAPALPNEAAFLTRLSGSAEFTETFGEALIGFTDSTYEEVSRGAEAGPAQGAEILNRFRKRLRTSRERPRSFLEALTSGEDSDNLEAEILADLYDPGQGMFNLYMTGQKSKDLRFFLRPRGALPAISSTEEVALVQMNPGELDEGILFMAPLAGTAQANVMDRALFDAQSYSIDSTIDGKELNGATAVTVQARRDGPRVIRFGLLPNLRVSNVTLGGAGIDFVQEAEDADGALYAILPESARKGAVYALRIEYAGNKVVSDEGGGNFAVGARTSWYPSLNSFQDRALFDLTFHTKPKLELVSVGKLTEDAKTGKLRKTRWISDVPLAVAGFNLGRFKAHEVKDPALGGYVIQGYASEQAPSYLQDVPDLPGQRIIGPRGGVAPSALIKGVMGEAQMSLRIFTNYFGPAPYGRIALTQQPQFNFGQSWPGLVYLPVSAFMDSTQRWALLGGATFRFSEFVQEVTAHEVAHQWWGHIVGWASYRDQWLSEGFADFSASLFLQLTRKDPSDYHKFIDRWRESILEKNEFGTRANDLGPISLGLRLNVPRVPGAYSRIVYSKGGYVLHMLRMLMMDAKEGEKAFAGMMREFVADRNGNSASTADFQRIAEKHFPRNRNADPNGKLDWFFDQWVHGQQIPSYKLEYSLTPSDGATKAKVQLTQSGVTPDFTMPVSVYADIGGQMIRLFLMTAQGSKTGEPYSIDLPADTRSIVLNYHRDVLADKTETVRLNQ